LNLPEDLAAGVAAAEPRLGPFTRRIHWYPIVPSTNAIAADLAEDGADEGIVIVADAQTAGRGRQGRTWASPSGAGLYVSVLLRPRPQAAPLLTVTAGVAIADAIESATGLGPVLKWPNDVYVGGRKLAGILAEAGGGTRARAHVVLGFGINVLPAALPSEVAGRATSLEAELGRPIDRGLLLGACLAALASRYAQLTAGRSGEIVSAWRRRAGPMLHRSVEWDKDGTACRGVAENIDDGGALLVRTGDGIVRVMSGEVRWIP
jgi:BirA family transcriptional regulator, biotin operon repressor / biotin---[acetyl-CoA-carboxylase] ligase